MENIFEQIIIEYKSVFEREQILVEKVADSNSTSSNPGSSYDFITETSMGRITCWESGEIDLEIIANNDISNYFYSHMKISDPSELEKIIKDMMQRLLRNHI